MILAGLSVAAFAAAAPLPKHDQLLLVRSDAWVSPRGTLLRYERSAGAWRAVGAAIPVTLGKTGMGWGRGVAVDPQASEPQKQEGDGRAPAGAFTLADAWGYAAAAPPTTHWPYHAATESIHCVDDAASPHYNRIVDAAALGGTPWKSSEKLRRKDALYTWLVEVRHNQEPATPGGGSCIFLHVWRAPDKPTVGCTAMAEPALVELLAWLDPAAQPLLVQLPQPAYERLRGAWALP